MYCVLLSWKAPHIDQNMSQHGRSVVFRVHNFFSHRSDRKNCNLQLVLCRSWSRRVPAMRGTGPFILLNAISSTISHFIYMVYTFLILNIHTSHCLWAICSATVDLLHYIFFVLQYRFRTTAVHNFRASSPRASLPTPSYLRPPLARADSFVRAWLLSSLYVPVRCIAKNYCWSSKYLFLAENIDPSKSD